MEKNSDGHSWSGYMVGERIMRIHKFFLFTILCLSVVLSPCKVYGQSGETPMTQKDNPEILIEGVDFILIPSGCFMMGSSLETDEQPVHERCVEEFYMGKYEITQDIYSRITGKNPSHFNNCPQCPAEMVTYEDTLAFMQIFNNLYSNSHHLLFALPTETQWEYAARSGKSSAYPWGEQKPICRSTSQRGALFDDDIFCDEIGTYAVGKFSPNTFGIYDMPGNVWEWVQDCYHGNYRIQKTEEPFITPECNDMAIRGGGWTSNPTSLRPANRNYHSRDGAANSIGFRMAARRFPPEKTPNPETKSFNGS